MNESLTLVQQGVDQATGVIRNLRRLGSLLRKESAIADVNAILGTAVSLMAGRAQRSGITIHQKYGSLPKTWCNPQSLSQVFVNLLQNACQAVKAKGNIWVATALEEKTITITVQDDGGGVPEDALPRVFEQYFSTNEGSTGIGLAISRRIVEEHGGTIGIVNSASGAKVIMVLPVRSD